MDIAVVVPTYNEVDNVSELVDRLDHVLRGRRWEVVFVDDDSPDGTHAVVRALARANPRVRCLQRVGRRGLARAVVEGILSTSASVLAVMDADMQHDETVLPAMIDCLDNPDVDLAIGTRYLHGSIPTALGTGRLIFSRIANRLAAVAVGARTTDPMSGFFVIKREAFDICIRRLSGEGYKILLDILASSPRPLRFIEIPYQFRLRTHGQSKLDTAVVWEYFMLLLDKRIGRWVPPRFVVFAAVGSSGVLVHLALLWLMFKQLSTTFAVAQGFATVGAMTSNYFLNNLITYRDRRHRGFGWLGGLLAFYTICGLGVIANVGVASALFTRQQDWLVAAAAGALVGTVWNYVANSAVTWRRQ